MAAEQQQQGDLVAEKPRICQAQGCLVDVNAHGRYCRKRRLCPDHLKAPALDRKKYGDEQWRFCQQCGKLELIHNFDGLKRSCRVQLARRRAANSSRGERRRSSATEPGRSTDNRTSSEGGSAAGSEGRDQPVQSRVAGATATGADSESAAGAAVAADAAAGAAAGAAGAGGAVAGAAAAVGVDAAYAWEQHSTRADSLPLDVGLAAYMQPQPEGLQPLHQTAQVQQGAPVHTPLREQQPGIFGLQQQQPWEGEEEEEEEVQEAGQDMPGSQSAAAVRRRPSATMSAESGVHSATSELLLQLLREQQQLRGWQQLQPAQACATTGRQAVGNPAGGLDVYATAAQGRGNQTVPDSRARPVRGMQGQQQQQQQLLQQRGRGQHSPQLSQAPASAAAAAAGAYATAPSSSETQPGMGSAACAAASAAFMGLHGPLAGVAGQESAAVAAPPTHGGCGYLHPASSLAQPAHVNSCGMVGPGGVHLMGLLPQTAPQQQELAELFLDSSYHSRQPGLTRTAAETGSLGTLEELEGLLAAAAAAAAAAASAQAFTGSDTGAGAAAAAAAAAAPLWRDRGPPELRSLSTGDTQNPALLAAGQQQAPQQRQLRAIDSAAAWLVFRGEAAEPTAHTAPDGAAVVCGGLLGLMGVPAGVMLSQVQPGIQTGAAAAAGAGGFVGMSPGSGVGGYPGAVMPGPDRGAGPEHDLTASAAAAAAAAMWGQGQSPWLPAGDQTGITGLRPFVPQQQQQQGSSFVAGQAGSDAAGPAERQASQAFLTADLQALLDSAMGAVPPME